MEGFKGNLTFNQPSRKKGIAVQTGTMNVRSVDDVVLAQRVRWKWCTLNVTRGLLLAFLPALLQTMATVVVQLS